MKDLIHRRWMPSMGVLKPKTLLLKLSSVLLMLGYCLVSGGQGNVQLSQPEIDFTNNRLIIKYDFLGVSSTDKFDVELEIRDSEGLEIGARSVYGDIGEDVSGTKGKQIIWDLAEDEFTMNQRVSVEIFATYIEPPKEVVTKIREPSTSSSDKKNDASTDRHREANSNHRGVSMGDAMLLSTLVPGLGVTRVSKGQPYWIAGVVGYGCLASSIAFGRMSVNSHNRYLDSSLPADEDPYYQKAVSQKLTSNIFLWSAVGLWLADLGYTGFRVSHAQKLATGAGLNKVSLASNWDNVNHSQSISLLYTF